MSFQYKNVILGVSGGIAAYKSPEIVRRLIDHGADVHVVMTAGACEFVRPLVFQAVSGNEVHTDLLDDQAEAGMGHIEFARWADIVLIAPATANTLAKMAAGLADDLLSTLCLATRAPVAVAPAMNSAMWEHPATLSNMQVLQDRGVAVLGPGVGSQACGETGAGRMWEPDDIVEYLQTQSLHGRSDAKQSASHSPSGSEFGSELAGELVSKSGKGLQGVDLLITAGPTRESIDPVRFLSNHSSGKMGFALAAAASDAGANVTLISGPVNLNTPVGVNRIDVSSAAQMQEAVMSRLSADGIFISVAAVADYRVAVQESEKIKKSDDQMTLNLVRNPDILAGVAQSEQRPFCVGFAAETQQLEQYARSKLDRKNLDMIVANLVGEDLAFGVDTNKVEVYWRGGSKSFSLQSKRQLADGLIRLITERYLSHPDQASVG